MPCISIFTPDSNDSIIASVYAAFAPMRSRRRSVPSHGAAYDDGEIPAAAEVHVAKHARVDAAGALLERAEDLAGAEFRGAGHAAWREGGGEDVDARLRR